MSEVKIEVPWERYGTITYLAQHVPSFGKTALQKLVYFLQEWKKVPLGYRFELYTYGPFSAALMSDLDYTSSLGAVKVDYMLTGGYIISAGDASGAILERSQSFLNQYQAVIAEVINVFGGYGAVQLELRATIHFACQEAEDPTDEAIVQAVQLLKPGKFTDAQIEQAIENLRQHHVIH